MKFEKRYCSPPELVTLLQKRGLLINNEEKAESYLKNIGYYRLSAYFYPLLTLPKEDHRFKPNSTFQQVMQIYRFDRKLRLIIFNEIEKIEIAIRCAIVNITSQETKDPFWMANSLYFVNQHRYSNTLSLIDKELKKSHEDFIYHFKETYTDMYPPAWELSEILPLGVITEIYKNIKGKRTQKKIAQRFYLNIPVFESWITLITLTRNSCCHHARIWNKENAIKCLFMKRMQRPWVNHEINSKRIFCNLCIIKYFVDIISPHNHFKQNLLNLFNNFTLIDKAAMGFPGNWEQEPLWL